MFMQRKDGTTVFYLDVPHGWTGPDYVEYHYGGRENEAMTAPDYESTLFTSPDKGAVFGFCARAQFELDGDAAREFDATLFPSPDKDAMRDTMPSIMHSFCCSTKIGEQLFNQDVMDNLQINGIRFQKFTGTNNGVPSYFYYTYIETVAGKFVFDGFICAYMSKEAFEQHQDSIEAAINSIQGGEPQKLDCSGNAK